jgi:hypothetical protein
LTVVLGNNIPEVFAEHSRLFCFHYIEAGPSAPEAVCLHFSEIFVCFRRVLAEALWPRTRRLKKPQDFGGPQGGPKAQDLEAPGTSGFRRSPRKP